MTNVLRAHAEQQYAEELNALVRNDDRPRPPGWKLSPWAAVTYLMGGKLRDGVEISPKYIGSRRLIEIAVATLATDRGLLLLGVPGTAKCVKHDTLVVDTRTGSRIPIAEVYSRRDVAVASLQSDYKLRAAQPTDYLDSGIQHCYRVTTHLGRRIEVTISHPFLTFDGWKPLSSLKPGDRIAVPRIMPFFGKAELSDAHVKLLGHLIRGKKSADKFVPDIVFRLPRRQIALFLNRLFSGAGFLQVRPEGQVAVDYSSTSERLIHDVQHLLLRFGINARTHQIASGHFRLFILGREACLTFLQEIGMLGRGGISGALDTLLSTRTATNPDLDTVPAQVWGHIEASALVAGYSSLGKLIAADRIQTSKVFVSRTHTQSISRARLLRSDGTIDADNLRNMAQSDIFWDSIESIEPIGEHQVYDLSIAETHNFVANDIIVHNSWVSEHLAAAIAGDSTMLIQGTAGTSEESIRYGWNYARLLADGPSPAALVASPLMRAMAEGKIARIEELTRIPADVQDTLITVLSEKTMPIPELNMEVQAVKGFNLIATANDRDKGVNDLSSALKRRFNTVVLPLPETLEQEVEIVQRRVASLGRALELPAEPPALEEIRRIVTVFRELRTGTTLDGRTKLKSPSGTLSTGEAISVVNSGLALAAHFGDGRLRAGDVAASLVGAVVKDPVQDRVAWQEYLETVVKERDGWKDLYRACRDVS